MSLNCSIRGENAIISEQIKISAKHYHSSLLVAGAFLCLAVVVAPGLIKLRLSSDLLRFKKFSSKVAAAYRLLEKRKIEEGAL